VSSLTWLDHSEADRKRALDFVDTFREAGTVDELGIGVIRDAFSDLLFPGTSTLHTRARYLLFVPWCYLRLEQYAMRTKRTYQQVANRARDIEAELMTALKSGEDNEGMLGKDAGAALKQLPSQVYWQGLGRLGIRVYGGTRAQLHRDLAHRTLSRSVPEMVDMDEPPATRDGLVWHADLPAEPKDFLVRVGFSLPADEAVDLRDRILARAPGTMLAHMMVSGASLDGATAPWEYSAVAELPDGIREQVRQARIFAVTMWGSALLYNLILAEKRAATGSESDELVERYRLDLMTWRDELEALQPTLDGWAPSHMWQHVTDRAARSPRTVAFVQEWFDVALHDSAGVAASDRARRLVSQREQMLKGRLSRIYNDHALELWSGASGRHLITYRWSNVVGLVRDVREGLERR
jgi:hypothetical protein